MSRSDAQSKKTLAKLCQVPICRFQLKYIYLALYSLACFKNIHIKCGEGSLMIQIGEKSFLAAGLKKGTDT